MEHETRALAQPCADLRVAMDVIVFEDHVQTAWRRKLTAEPTQKAEKILMSMPRIMFRDHPALADMERGKQAGRAVLLILVG